MHIACLMVDTLKTTCVWCLLTLTVYYYFYFNVKTVKCYWKKSPPPNKGCRYKNKQIGIKTRKYLLKMCAVLYNTEYCRVFIILATRESLLKLKAKSFGTDLML